MHSLINILKKICFLKVNSREQFIISQNKDKFRYKDIDLDDGRSNIYFCK